jgi:hypothetical protein
VPGPWRFFLADSATPSAPIEELDLATNRSMTFTLNQPGEVSFNYPLLDAKADYIQPLSRCITVMKGGDVVWSGPVWTVQESISGNSLQVKAIGWLEILNHRIMRMIWPDVTLPVFQNPSAASNASGWIDSVGGTVSRDTSTFQSSPASIRLTTAGSDPNESAFDLGTGFNSVTFEPTHSYEVSGYFRVAPTPTPVPGTSNGLLFQFGNFPAFDVVKKRVDYSGGWQAFSVGWTPRTSYSATPIPAINTFLRISAEVEWLGGAGTQVNFDSLSVTKTKLVKIQAVFNNVDAGQIVKTVLDEINLHSPSGITLPPGNIQASANRTRTYQKYANVGQAIQELVNIENGFDIGVNPITKELSIYYKSGPPTGYGNNRTNVVFGAGVGGMNNLASASRTIDGSRVANYVVATGQYGSAVDSDTGSIASYGAFEEVVNLADVPNVEVLAAYAGVEVAGRSLPREILTIVPRPRLDPYDTSVPTLYDDYWIGDIVYVNIAHGRLQVVEQALRIFSLTVTIDDSGTERIDNIQTSLET